MLGKPVYSRPFAPALRSFSEVGFICGFEKDRFAWVGLEKYRVSGFNYQEWCAQRAVLVT
jgi:hypothetical protein